MSLDATDQALADVEEQNELSTSSEDQQPEAEAADQAESNEEPQEAQQEEPEQSTEPKPKKPRRRKVDAEMRALEDRITTMVDQRLAQSPTPPEQTAEGNTNAQPTAQENLLARRTQQFNQELIDLRTSQDAEEQKIARTIDDGLAGRNALADIDSRVVQQLLIDGITPDELHDLNENYGDQLIPQSPEVEYRTIKRYLRQIRGGTVTKKDNVTPIRKPHKPVTTVPGTGAGLRSEKTAEALEKRFRGK